MEVRIIKPNTLLFEGEATLVQLPSTNGLFEILNNHAPIISALGKGQIRVVTDQNQELMFDIKGGVIKGQQNKILILVQ